MKYVSFSFNSWEFPFLMSIFYSLQLLCGIYMTRQCFLFLPILISFSLLFAVIPENISLYLSRKQFHPINTKDTKEIERMSLSPFKLEREKKQKNRKLLGLYFLLGFLSYIENFFVFNISILQTYNYSSLQSFIGLLLIWVLSYLIFKKKLHRHHIFALAMILIDTVIFYWIESESFLVYIEELFFNSSGFIIVILLYVITFSSKEVIEHYCIRILYFSPQRILMIEGLTSFVLLLLTMSFIQLNNDNNTQKPTSFFNQIIKTSRWELFIFDLVNIFNYSTIQSLYAYGFIISSLLMNFFRIQTNRRLSPTHRCLAEMVFGVFWLIYDIFTFYIPENVELTAYYNRIIQSLFMFIPFVIYNEYVIIRICGLEVNTYLEIDKRAQDDSKLNQLFELNMVDNDDDNILNISLDAN